MQKILDGRETNPLLARLVAFVICMQNAIWPFWYGIATWSSYLAVILIFLLELKDKRLFNLNISHLIILLFALFVFIIVPIFYDFRFSNVLILMAYFSAINIKQIEASMVLKYTTSYLYIIILLSFPFWIIHQYIYELPVYGELDLSEMKDAVYIYSNYFFFVTDAFIDYYRFYSMFDEPGVLGTFAAFVLYGNRYDFSKKENVVILVASLFTYSMAFYVLTILGWVYQSRKSVKKIMALLLVLIGVAFALMYYLKDDVAFQRAIIDRVLGFDISLVENRTNDYVNMFWKEYINSLDCILGMGTSFLNNFFLFGNSYKRFVIEYGLIGIFLLVLMYLKLVKKWNSLIVGLCVIYILSFFQRPFAFTAWQIYLFTVICLHLNVSKNEYP